MRGFGIVLCLFVCSWVLVLGGEGFLAVCGNSVSIIFTFIRVVAVANYSSVGSRYIVSFCVGAVRVLPRGEKWWVVGDVRDESEV